MPEPSKSTDDKTLESTDSTLSVQSGGIDIAAQQVSVGGDVVGRDKIVNNIQHIYERALTAAEEAEQEKEIEAKHLAQGVSMFAQNLRTHASETADTAKGSPYKGLLEYRLGDAEIFYGRAEAIRDVLGCLQRGPLTVLQSESGAGKTSLLKAGLSPQLIAAGHLPLYLSLYDVEPAYVIKRAFISDPRQTPNLAEAPLRDFLRQACRVLGQNTRLYILLDQFEYFFTLLDNPARDEFVRELAECLDDESLNVRWLLALRAEYFGNLANFQPRIGKPFENNYRLNRLTRDEAVQVITKPAAQRSISFELGLVNMLLDDLGKNEIAPPQLQLVCAALFDELAEGETTITRALYEREGGAAGILRGYLEQVLSRNLRREDRGDARRVLESLISSERQRIIRTRAELVDELGKRDVMPQTLDTILTQLVNSRLLRTEETDAGIVYELAHDYLVQEIRLDPEVQARKAAQELLEQEVRAYRRHKMLLTEDRLNVIEPHRTELNFTPEAAALFMESKQAIEKEHTAREQAIQKERAARERRRKALFAGVIGVAVVMALLAIIGLNNAAEADRQAATATYALGESEQRGTVAAQQAATAEAASTLAIEQSNEAQRQARIAFSRLLAAQSVARLDDQFDLALLLALETERLGDTFEARDSLLTALSYSPHLSAFLYAHDDSINSVAFSPDGKILALGSGDSTVSLWDVSTRQRVGDALDDHSEPVTSVAFSPDGETLASGSFDHTAILWDVTARQKLVGPLRGHVDVIESVAFSPDGAVLATSSRDKSIILWNVATGEKGSTLLGDHASWVIALAYSPDGKMLASADGLGKIILWNLVTRQPAGSLESGQGGAVVKLAFSPDGKTLISVRYDGRIFLWDVTSRQALGDPLVAASGSELVLDAAFSPDGRVLAVPDRNNILLWDLTTRQQIGEPLMGHNRVVASLAFSRDGVTLASGSASGTVILWNVNRQHRLAESWATGDVVTSLDFSPDGKVLASSSYNSKSITLWNTRTWEPLGQPLVGHSDVIDSVRFSPDGRTLASAGKDKRVVLWDLSSQRPVGEPLTGHQAEVFSVAFSPDGRLLASGSDDGMVVLWDAATRQRIGQPLTDHKDWVYSVSFSPDGRILASGGGDGTIILWDVSDPQLPVRLTSSLPHGAPVFSIAFSPDGSTLASGGMDKSITLWDAKTWQQIGEPFTGHVEAVVSLDFSNDGTTLVSGSLDNTIILWDTATGNRLGPPLSSHQDWIYGIAFSPDGKMLASGGKDESIVLWDVDVESWQIQACMIVRRNFTRAEWAQYFPGEEYHKTCEQWPEGE